MLKYMYMARLPIPGQDSGAWGTILNDFLSTEHAADGTLKLRSDGTLNAYATTASLADYVQKSQRDHVSLLDFVPNGPDGTTNNSAAFTQAIAAAAAGPGRLFVPKRAASWVIGTPVTINADIEIFSDSWGNMTTTPCIKAAAGLNDYMFKFGTTRPDGNRITFRTIEIDGNNGAQTAGGIILANNAVQCIFDSVHLHHAYDTALYFKGLVGSGPFGHHNRITNSLFDNSGSSAGNGRALVIESTDEVMVANTDFEANGNVNSSEPYHIKDWSGINSFVNCVFVGGGEAIRMQDIKGTRVMGCTFDGVGRTAVHITGSEVQVVGNYFSGINTAATNTYFHIYMDNGGYNTITGNVFTSGVTVQGLRGMISHQPTAFAVIVSNNIFRTTGGGNAALGDGGIYDWNGSDATTQTSQVKINAGLADQ